MAFKEKGEGENQSNSAGIFVHCVVAMTITLVSTGNHPPCWNSNEQVSPSSFFFFPPPTLGVCGYQGSPAIVENCVP